MPRHNSAAMLASAVVLVVAAGFCSYAVLQHQGSGHRRYILQAVFPSSNGLQVGADVRLAGVKVGTVSSITLDRNAFVTRVEFRIDDRFRLPSDTALRIGSSGFTSANALLIDPGRSSRPLVAGDTIRDTHPLQSLEETISNYIFGGGGLGGTGP